MHAHAHDFCLSYLCRCRHDLLIRPRALRYGLRFAKALKATGAEDVCDRDQAQGQGKVRRNCIDVSRTPTPSRKQHIADDMVHTQK